VSHFLFFRANIRMLAEHDILLSDSIVEQSTGGNALMGFGCL
jgi:hypothetical protein